MGTHFLPDADLVPLIRPRLLVKAARIGAGLYRRWRDLGAALPGAVGLGGAEIKDRLFAVERACEEQRRQRSPVYRPGRHVQVLSALLAEAAAGDQTKASGSAALRLAM